MNELQMVWNWQPALYLFLGGMGAGAFVMAGLLYYRHRAGNERVLNASAWAATLCLIVGLLLLLTELTNPLRGMMLWQSFSHFTSWMTVGAWLLFAAVVVFGLTAVLSTGFVVKKAFKSGPAERLIAFQHRAFAVLVPLGMALGVGVAAYTGVLLMSAPGVPLWNTLLLPCLFAVSGLDTGVALVEVISLALERRQGRMATACEASDEGDGEPPRDSAPAALANATASHRLMSRCVLALAALESIILFALLASAATSALGSQPIVAQTASASAEVLLAGMLAPLFWILVVACGLIIPIAVAAMGIGKRAASANTLLVGALGAMAGGCALRFLVLAAGFHADVVGAALEKLLM